MELTRRATVTGRIALALALIGALLLAASGPAVRMGLVSFTVGILMLPAAGALGFAAAILALVALWRDGGVAQGVLALVLGLAIGAVPAAGHVIARSAPRLHAISTAP